MSGVLAFGWVVVVGVMAVAAPAACAHDGPPYPIVSDRQVGPYLVSIWTDPDTTDDGSPGGQFWVQVDPLDQSRALPDGTQARVAIQPRDRNGPELQATAAPVRGDATNQFASLVMDHEGRFTVRVRIVGPLGGAAVESEVDATYDLRPSPYLLPVYVLPFVVVGLLWGRLLVRRRGARRVA